MTGISPAITSALGQLLKEQMEEVTKKIDALSQSIDERIDRSKLNSDLMLAEAKASLVEIRAAWDRDTDSLNKLRIIDGDRTFQKGEYGILGASLYRARVETKDPGDDGAWDLIAAGVDHLLIDQDGRDVVVDASVGGEFKTYVIDRTIEPVGGYKSGETYYRNDVVMKDGQSWWCVVDQTDIEPGTKTDKPVWRLHSMKGDRGEKGDRGQRGQPGIEGKAGADGVGILDAKIYEMNLAFALSDGSVIAVDLSGLLPSIEKLVEAKVNKMLEPKKLEMH